MCRICVLLLCLTACAAPDTIHSPPKEKVIVKTVPPNPIDVVKQYAMSLEGAPYIWGGDSRNGFDCSGLVIDVLQFAGVFPNGYDNTAQGLFSELLDSGQRNVYETGSIAFYGRNIHNIKHVAFIIDKNTVISAAGGDRRTTRRTPDAYVKVTPINNRGDLIGAIMPKYDFLGGEYASQSRVSH